MDAGDADAPGDEHGRVTGRCRKPVAEGAEDPHFLTATGTGERGRPFPRHPVKDREHAPAVLIDAEGPSQEYIGAGNLEHDELAGPRGRHLPFEAEGKEIVTGHDAPVLQDSAFQIIDPEHRPP